MSQENDDAKAELAKLPAGTQVFITANAGTEESAFSVTGTVYPFKRHIEFEADGDLEPKQPRVVLFTDANIKVTRVQRDRPNDLGEMSRRPQPLPPLGATCDDIIKQCTSGIHFTSDKKEKEAIESHHDNMERAGKTFRHLSPADRLGAYKAYDREAQLIEPSECVSIKTITKILFDKVLVMANNEAHGTASRRYVEVDKMDETTPAEINKTTLQLQVVIVTGESGSGKTMAALMSSKLLHGVAVLMVAADFTRVWGNRTERDKSFVADVANFLDEHIHAGLKSHQQLKTDENVPITLILDEMGNAPDLVRALCSTREEIVAVIAKATCTATSNIRLVAAGTGVSHSTVSQGSDTASFRVVPVMDAVGKVWQVLKGLPASCNLALACDKDDPSPAATALNSVAGNARCAALIVKALKGKTLWKPSPEHPLVESQLWYLYHTAVYEFHGLNAFLEADRELCEDLFGRAFYLYLTGYDKDLPTERDQMLITKFGILTDTAEGTVNGVPSGWKKVPATEDAANRGPVVPAADNQRPAVVLMIKKGTVRYTMSRAAVQLGLSCFGCLDVMSWEGFEGRIAQIFLHASMAFCGQAAPSTWQQTAPQWVEGAGVLLDTLRDGIFSTLPRQVADSNGRSSDVEYQSTHLMRSAWQLTASDIAAVLSAGPASGRELARADSPKAVFLDSLRLCMDGNKIVVVINGSSAPGPDVIVLARGWYVGVQCKMIPSSTITSADVGAEIKRMRLPPGFTGVQHCCIIVAGTKPPDLGPPCIAKKPPPAKKEKAKLAAWTETIGISSAKQQLHFIYLGCDTAAAGLSAHPFCIPFGTSIVDTVQRNSNSVAGLQLDFNPTSRKRDKAALAKVTAAAQRSAAVPTARGGDG
jgi:hypothetical protein